MIQVFPTRNIHLVKAVPDAELELTVCVDLPFGDPAAVWTDVHTAQGSALAAIEITSLTVGASPATITKANDATNPSRTSTLTPPAISDTFAPGQYTQMSSDDRLVAPSFEALHAGVSIGADAVARGATVTSSMDIETFTVDPLAPPDPPPRGALEATLAAGLMNLHASPAPAPGPTLSPLRYALATVAALQTTAETTAIAGGATTYNALASAARRAGVPVQVVTAAELH